MQPLPVLEQITVGSHRFWPVYLAPLSGITDYPCRAIARAVGAPLVVSEMIASEAVIAEHKDAGKLPDWTKEAGDAERPLIVQLAGTEPEVIAQAVKMVGQLGADIIDLNFGCPARRVVKKASGSALMRDPVLCEEIFRAAVEASAVPVTAKMRLGWDAQLLTGVDVAQRAERSGISLITVHGRTRCQFYEGHADHNAVARVAEAVNLPVITNGDIDSIDAAAAALRASGANGLMIGRAATGNPWLLIDCLRAFTPESPGRPQSSHPNVDIRCWAAIEHLALLLNDPRFRDRDPKFAIRHYRKHLAGYLAPLSLPKAVAAHLMSIDEPVSLASEIERACKLDSSGTKHRHRCLRTRHTDRKSVKPPRWLRVVGLN